MILVDLWTLKVLHLCWNSHNTVFLFPNYTGLCWPFCLFLPVSCRMWRPLQGQKIPSSNVKNRDAKAFFVSFSSNIPEEKNGSKTFSLLFPKAAPDLRSGRRLVVFFARLWMSTLSRRHNFSHMLWGAQISLFALAQHLSSAPYVTPCLVIASNS